MNNVAQLLTQLITDKNCLEPDLDTIYKVLKKVNDIPIPDKTLNVAGSMTPMDIPIVTVPDYPDRTPRRGPYKNLGSNFPQQNQGLSAPTPDVSSSGPHQSFFKCILFYAVDTKEKGFPVLCILYTLKT